MAGRLAGWGWETDFQPTRPYTDWKALIFCPIWGDPFEFRRDLVEIRPDLFEICRDLIEIRPDLAEISLISSRSAEITPRSGQVSPDLAAFGKIRQFFSQPETDRGPICTRWKSDHPNRLRSPVGGGSVHEKPEVIGSVLGWAQTRPVDSPSGWICGDWWWLIYIFAIFRS